MYGSDGGDEEIDHLLDLVNLDSEGRRRKFGNCSTGMKQRLGIAAALLGNPSLVILDEPTNGLDPAGIIEVRELIRKLGASPGTPQSDLRTVILATHLLSEAEQVCDNVGVMARGRILYSGPVSGISGRAQVRIQTTDDVLAESILRSAGWSINENSADGLKVAAASGKEWEISRDLANSGVYISEMILSGGTLEEGFLEVTGNAEGD